MIAVAAEVRNGILLALEARENLIHLEEGGAGVEAGVERDP